jgi:hypothetical protein
MMTLCLVSFLYHSVLWALTKNGKRVRNGTGTQLTSVVSKRSNHRSRSQTTVAKKLNQFLAEGRAYEHGQKKIEEYTGRCLCWYLSGMVMSELYLVILNLDLPFPDHFAGWTRDRWLVAQNAAEGGWLQPSELPDITTDD